MTRRVSLSDELIFNKLIFNGESLGDAARVTLWHGACHSVTRRVSLGDAARVTLFFKTKKTGEIKPF